ncbi:TomO hydrophobic C-terminal domain-containing protein [Wolbachia endosymbiont of Drosophila pseudotakahashii]|uniref:TomO hydrophobic C-terminal domain-containing protein n=1 Tax=Wolbachia endosymbiont of Drosophila pseudotakahashii TaxID=375919 RepID=UPI00222EB694|nr:hypothetical protein [Wolbachia endosymbiont of Drosophila pseudotakahashii]MCX3065215.1 hypothetical protein [Wolbachia endosymbiont of Drosophila pseudotakahashii]UZE38194.1 hypothetical protein ONI09_04705 [Wolbachia endosymbiont of Drosophila pseudotakahashii]
MTTTTIKVADECIQIETYDTSGEGENCLLHALFGDPFEKSAITIKDKERTKRMREEIREFLEIGYPKLLKKDELIKSAIEYLKLDVTENGQIGDLVNEGNPLPSNLIPIIMCLGGIEKVTMYANHAHSTFDNIVDVSKEEYELSKSVHSEVTKKKEVWGNSNAKEHTIFYYLGHYYRAKVISKNDRKLATGRSGAVKVNSSNNYTTPSVSTSSQTQEENSKQRINVQLVDNGLSSSSQLVDYSNEVREYRPLYENQPMSMGTNDSFENDGNCVQNDYTMQKYMSLLSCSSKQSLTLHDANDRLVQGFTSLPQRLPEEFLNLHNTKLALRLGVALDERKSQQSNQNGMTGSDASLDTEYNGSCSSYVSWGTNWSDENSMIGNNPSDSITLEALPEEGAPQQNYYLVSQFSEVANSSSVLKQAKQEAGIDQADIVSGQVIQSVIDKTTRNDSTEQSASQLEQAGLNKNPLENAFQISKGENKRFLDEIRKKEEDLRQAQQEIDNLESKVLTQKLQQEEELKKINTQLTESKNLAGDLTNKTTQLTEENTQLKDNLKTITETNTQLQNELESTRKTLGEKDSTVIQLTEENTELKLEKPKNENNDLKTKLQESESKSKGLESRIENLQKQLSENSRLAKEKDLGNENKKLSAVSAQSRKQVTYASVSFVLSGAFAVGASLTIPYLAICITFAVAASIFLATGFYCSYKANTALSNVEIGQINDIDLAAT